MAAPTSVRVESNSLTSNALNWVYGGTNAIQIWRALHGGAFAVIATTLTTTPVLTYVDETAVAGTFYDYKLTDDGGSTFSSVVSVVTQTCPSTTGSNQSTNSLGLPQFMTDEDINAAQLQQMSQQVEAGFNTQVVNPQNCEACPVNGSVVIDCSDGCYNFSVTANQDINSISIIQCNQGTVEFIIPPNVTRKICGWPAGFGFTGDECFNSPIVSGPKGRTASATMRNGSAKAQSSKAGYGAGSGGGGAAGGGCACVPTGAGALTIKSCTPNNSLNCRTTKVLTLLACGGKPPYSWSKVGSVVLSKATGNTTTVKPPTNTGPTVGGNAYFIQVNTCGSCSGPNVCIGAGPPITAIYGCNDDLLQCVTTSGACGGLDITNAAANSCCTGPGGANRCDSSGPYNNCPPPVDGSISNSMCDQRSAPMIASGCAPCGLSFGATVSVTDSVGVVTTIIIRN